MISPPNSLPATPISQQAGISLLAPNSDRAKVLAARRAEEKTRLNVIVIGHVDAGKSTMMGHLLFQQGKVTEREIRRFEKESKEMGKTSFHFAWVLDQNEGERSRGQTREVATQYFETTTKSITLLDAPGHRDFIPSMIGGAYQADAAILVVPTGTEFNGGFAENGQTKEHAVLARSLGIRQLIVCVNKMDSVGWSQTEYDSIINRIQPFLVQTGFEEKNIWPIPVSGLGGGNLCNPISSSVCPWYSGPCLLELIDRFSLPDVDDKLPFRMSVDGVLGLTLTGKIETGSVFPKDKLLLMPLNLEVIIKNIEVGDSDVKAARAGECVKLALKSAPDETAFLPGMILCDPTRPIQCVKTFKAKIVTLELTAPLLIGSQVVLLTNSTQEPAVLTRMIATLDKKTGEAIERKPRALGKHSCGIVKFTVERPICLELYSQVRGFGRVTFRQNSNTVAIGHVTKLYPL